MKIRPSLSVVIPCYNEEGNVPLLVERLGHITSQEPRIEFILVNNGSRDNTGKFLSELASGKDNLTVINIADNIGYGHGIKSGLRAATGDYVGWTHADLQTRPEDTLQALSMAESSRTPVFIKGVRYGRPKSDALLSLGMSLFESVLFGRLLKDINAQPTVFSKSFLPSVLMGPDDFGLDLYSMVEAKDLGLKELRFLVHFGARFSGVSKWNTSAKARFRFILRTLQYSLRLAANRGRS
jgi:glycosyltransferase involved in cell wall biosynthesis